MGPKSSRWRCFRVPDRGSVNPTALAGRDCGICVKMPDYGFLQTWQPYGLGLQVPLGVGDEVSLSGIRPPNLSVSRAVQYLKGRSSHKLLSEFGILRKRYWGQHLWARGYWVASSGNVTDEVWAEYIKNQTPPEPDDDFNVT